MNQDCDSPERLLRLREVIRRTGLGRSSIYSYEKLGQFPKRVKIGARSVAWPEHKVDMWIATRKTA